MTDCTEQVAQLQAQISGLTILNESYAAKIDLLQGQIDMLAAQNHSTLGIGNLSVITTTFDNGQTQAKFLLPNGSEVVRTIPQDGELTMRLALGLGLTHEHQPDVGGGTPEWLEDFRAPSGDLPLFAAKFTTGDYWLNGAAATVTDIFAGEHFDPDAIDSNGLSPTNDGVNIFENPQIALLSSAALAHVASGNFTIYMRIAGSLGGTTYAFVGYDTDYNTASEAIFGQRVSAGGAYVADFNQDVTTAIGSWPAESEVGVAWNIFRNLGGGNYRSKVAVQGIASGDMDSDHELNLGVLGFGVGEDPADPANSAAPSQPGIIFIKSLAVWAAQPDADVAPISQLTIG